MRSRLFKIAAGIALSLIVTALLAVTIFDVDDFLPVSTLVRRFGFEMPRSASEVAVNDEEDAMVISFRLNHEDFAKLRDQHLPAYSGWRVQRQGEVFPSLGGIPSADWQHQFVNEKRAGASTWRILLNPANEECIAYFER